MAHKQLTFRRDSHGKWRWTLRARNGRIIDASSQGFARKHGAKKNFYRVLTAMNAVV